MSTFKNINVQEDINVGGFIYSDQFFIMPGDTFTTTIDTGGFITSSSSTVRFIVPCSKQIHKDVTNYSLSFIGAIRQGGKYIFGDGSENTKFTGTSQLWFFTDNIRIKLYFSSALSGAVNNDVVGIAGTVNINFT